MATVLYVLAADDFAIWHHDPSKSSPKRHTHASTKMAIALTAAVCPISVPIMKLVAGTAPPQNREPVFRVNVAAKCRPSKPCCRQPCHLDFKDCRRANLMCPLHGAGMPGVGTMVLDFDPSEPS